jgi:energy-coupling factor transport system permease protein
MRIPRALHPGAWWLWALGMAVAASRTTNPVVLLLIVAVVAFVVSARRTDAPWARGFKVYVYLGLVVIAVRLVFRVLLDAQHGAHVLFTLPEVPLPDAVAGIRLGGPVSLEGVLAAVYDGLRLATLLLCVGAANVLADPKRMLRSLPAALHEVGVAVTVALSVAPQLIESGQRVRRARRLRGQPGRRFHVVREVALPVMTDALDRSLLLAAAMDARGYGRTADRSRRARAVTGGLLVGGVVAIAIGSYGLLDSTASAGQGWP